MPRRSRSNLELETDPEVSKRSAGGHRPRRKTTTDPLNCDRDIIDIVMSFLGTPAYISMASVSTKWRNAWGQQSTVTSRRWVVQSRSCLDWARACGLEIWDDPCLFAAAEGRLDVLQHAVALGYSREGMPICEWAAGGGHLEVVKWCRANGYPWGWSSVRAAKGGHLEVLKWCVAHGCPIKMGEGPRERVNPRYLYRGKQIRRKPRVMDVSSAAAWGGHLEILMWCKDQGYQWCRETCRMAVMGGHLDVLKWLRANGSSWSRRMMGAVASTGDVDLLRWCKANGCPWDHFVLFAAAGCGNVEAFKWCAANEPYHLFGWIAMNCAAARGHLEVVQWMRASGYQWGNQVCYMAACGDHLEVLKWCLANGCPWGPCTRHYCTPGFKGSVSMMIWAASNQCPWLSSKPYFDGICEHAARGGNLEVLLWCAGYRPLSISAALRGAASNGEVHILEWLRTSGRLWDVGVDDISLCATAARSGSLETVKWCRANNFPWSSQTIKAAMESGNLEVLHWCRANGCPWGTETPGRAILKSNIEMLAWCHSNGCPMDLSLILRKFRSIPDEVTKWVAGRLSREPGEQGQEPL